MADADRAVHAARLLSTIVAGLALAFAAVAYALNPSSIAIDALRLVAIPSDQQSRTLQSP